MKILLLFLLKACLVQKSLAQQVDSIPQLGKHVPIFTYEKNENPQNIMVIYTKVDSFCKIIKESSGSNKPAFDFYWKMNRITYKPVHSLIKIGIRNRLQVAASSENDNFMIKLKDLKEVQTDIKDARMTIRSNVSTSKECEVQSTMQLGPSDKNITLKIASIYSETVKTMFPPFRRLKSVTLIGVNIKTGEKLSRKYLAK